MWRPSCGLELMPAARTDSGRLRGSRPLLTLSINQETNFERTTKAEVASRMRLPLLLCVAVLCGGGHPAGVVGPGRGSARPAAAPTPTRLAVRGTRPLGATPILCSRSRRGRARVRVWVPGLVQAQVRGQVLARELVRGLVRGRCPTTGHRLPSRRTRCHRR